MNVDRAASLVGVVAVVVAGSVAVTAGRAADPPAVFTAAQAEAGRQDVQTNTFGTCTNCHGETLTGRTGAPGELPLVSSLPADAQKLIAGNGGRVPSLVGPTFVARWARRSTKDLTREFEERFGVLSEATRLNLIAYFLRESGAPPGAEPLTAATDVTIGAIVPQLETVRRFEVASVKQRQPGLTPPQTRMIVTPGRISFQAVFLKDAIRWSYGLADYQVTGAPEWIERTPRWDIEATAGAPATELELQEMFRTLLAERFGFRARRGTLESRAYILAVSPAGSKLRPAAADAPRSDDWRLSPLFQRTKPGPGTTLLRELSARRVTMRYLAEYLTRQLRVPVVDQTGLAGDFEFLIEWPADAASVPAADRGRGVPPPTGTSPADMFGTPGIEALRDQLGLTLTPARSAIDVLIVDAVEPAAEN